MNYSVIKKCDVANGLGVRVSIFVSGCRNHCDGCFNKETWDFRYGKPYTKDTEYEILEALKPSWIKGLSILGGEPLEPENRFVLCGLLKKVKEEYPEKDIWLYTGYKFEDVKDYTILKYVDILVDGPFVKDEKDAGLAFRGSKNQKILDLRPMFIPFDITDEISAFVS